MNKNCLVEKFDNIKVKDQVSDRLKKILVGAGFPIKGSLDSGMYYIVGGLAIPVENEVVFNAINASEIPAEVFYKKIELTRRICEEYVEGQLVTYTTEGGAKRVFINLGDLLDGNLLGYGEIRLSSNSANSDVFTDSVRYDKSRCRKSNASEISIFLKAFTEATGIQLKRDGSKVNIFFLRPYDQVYYYIIADWKDHKFVVKKTQDQGTFVDDDNFQKGNYFETEQEAVEAIGMIKI